MRPTPPHQWGRQDSRHGRYGIFGRNVGSFRLDTRELDHLGPLLGFVGDELCVVGGRTGEYRAAKVGNPRLHRRIGKASVDFPVSFSTISAGVFRGAPTPYN